MAFGLPAAAVDVAPWCAVIKGGEFGTASIALWKIAILMSWEALAAGVIRIGISSQRRQNPKVQRVVALDERRVAFCCASWSAGGPYAPRNSFAKIKRYGRIDKALPNNIAAILVTPSQSESRSNAVVSMKVVHVI